MNKTQEMIGEIPWRLRRLEERLRHSRGGPRLTLVLATLLVVSCTTGVRAVSSGPGLPAAIPGFV
jgi:hypothetical protein